MINLCEEHFKSLVCITSSDVQFQQKPAPIHFWFRSHAVWINSNCNNVLENCLNAWIGITQQRQLGYARYATALEAQGPHLAGTYNSNFYISTENHSQLPVSISGHDLILGVEMFQWEPNHWTQLHPLPKQLSFIHLWWYLYLVRVKCQVKRGTLIPTNWN